MENLRLKREVSTLEKKNKELLKLNHDLMAKNKINLFHGTNGNALPSILKYGVSSIYSSQQEGIDVITGEVSTRLEKPRGFVSFTDVLDIAIGYSTLSVSGEVNDELSFPVVIGTTKDDVIETGTYRISSDVCEVGVGKKLPKERIRMICVPSDKVNIVKKIVNNEEIIVAGIDDIESMFYSIEDIGMINFYPDKLKELRDNLTKHKRKFSLEELRQLVFKKGVTKHGK